LIFSNEYDIIVIDKVFEINIVVHQFFSLTFLIKKLMTKTSVKQAPRDLDEVLERKDLLSVFPPKEKREKKKLPYRFRFQKKRKEEEPRQYPRICYSQRGEAEYS